MNTKIRYLFQSHAKGFARQRGFNIEDINLRSDKKIELMMGVLAITFLIALREGILRHLLKPIPMKKYKSGLCYPAISLFRLGFAIIQNLFNEVKQLIKYIDRLLKHLPDKGLKSIENYILVKNV